MKALIQPRTPQRSGPGLTRRIRPVEGCANLAGGFLRWSLAQAFTLVEIMIAMAIFSGVLVAIYASWTAVLRASKTGI